MIVDGVQRKAGQVVRVDDNFDEDLVIEVIQEPTEENNEHTK